MAFHHLGHDRFAGHSLVAQTVVVSREMPKEVSGNSAARFLVQLDEGELGGAIDSHTPTRELATTRLPDAFGINRVRQQKRP